MKSEFTQLKKQLEGIRLSASERERVDGVLAEYRAHHPAGTPSVEPSFAHYHSWFAAHRFVAAVAVALVLTFAGGTISYAAEGALPGDVLYPVKVGVNEPLRGALARTPEGKALFEVEKVSRRLAEAEVLALEGRFDASRREIVEVRITEHIGAVHDRVAALADTGEERNDFDDIVETLDAMLDVHGSILAALEEDDRDGREISMLLARARRSTPARTERDDIRTGEKSSVSEPALAVTEDSEKETEDGAGAGGAADDLALEIAETEEALEELQEHAPDRGGRVRVSVQNEVERLLDVADEALKEAGELLDERRFEEAEVRLDLARRVTRRISVMLETFMTLPPDIKLFPIDPYPSSSHSPAETSGLPESGEVEGALIDSDWEKVRRDIGANR